MDARLLASEAMSDWDAYVLGHAQASVYHLSGWRRVIRDVFGKETYYFGAEEDGRLRGVLPLVRLNSLFFGDFLVSMPYVNYGGVLADGRAAREALIAAAGELARRLGVRHVELRHTENLLDLPVRTDRICMHLELPDDAAELWTTIGSKLRAQIRRPQREGVQFVTGGAELLDDFYPVFSRKYRDLGVPVYPQRWFRALLLEFPQRSLVTLVRLNGKPAASSIVIDFNGRAEVAWAASVREADRLGANMFLYWTMLETAISRGNAVFDFGRTTEGSGTHRFKKQWGAQPVPLYWHYLLCRAEEIPRLNLDNPGYQAAAQLWRRMPLWLTNTVGPWLVKSLP